VRISHTIDPRDGRPIRHGLASVTVLHPETMWADAWATALDVLGPEVGFDRAEEEGLPAYFIVREPSGGFESRETSKLVSLRAASP
jgi:thiamine biosynthesis lipoprotein